MTLPRNSILVAACSLVLVGLCAPGRAGIATPGVTAPPEGFYPDGFVVIGFDTDLSGAEIPPDTDIRDQYKDLGVLFSLQDDAPTSAFLGTAPRPSGISSWGNDAISQPNTLAAWHEESDNAGLTVVIDFVDSFFGSSLPTSAGLVFADSAPNNPFTLRAYDAAGALVDEVTIDTADGSAWSASHAEDTFCGVTFAGGISRLEYSTAFMSGSGITGVEIDDVSYAVPEPATILLLALGTLAALRHSTFRRHD
jgi:hypothetical protein